MAQGTQPSSCIPGDISACVTSCRARGCAVGGCNNQQSCICDHCNGGSGPPSGKK